MGKKLNKESFVERSNVIHHNKYDYSKVEYINSSTKVCIICPEHGEFWQSPNKHMSGRGCPKCAENLRNKKSDEINQNISIILSNISLIGKKKRKKMRKIKKF